MERKIGLLVVDPQNDFFPGGALGVADGNKIINPTNRMLDIARKNGWRMAVSRDWHLADSKHFEKWPPHCVQNTWGAEYHKDLNLKGTKVISKGMGVNDDGYDAFGIEEKAYSLEDKKTLQQHLGRLGILYVAGLATDYCVKNAVLSAIKLGYTVHLLTDAIAAVNLKKEDGKKALLEMEKAGAILTTSEQAAKLYD